MSRNFFIVHDRVVAAAQDGNKSEAVTHTPMVVGRFLHARVVRIFIAYAADVFPFQQ